MDLSELKNKLTEDLDKQLVFPNAILSSFSVVDPLSRQSPIYTDPRNYTFYYHLGKYLKPKSLLEIGFELGFRTACFLKSCDSVEEILAYQRPTESYFSRLAIKNVKSLYKKNLKLVSCHIDKLLLDNTYDLAFINEDLGYDDYRNIFDAVFEKMELNGIIIIGKISEKVCGDAFKAFCKIQNREPVTINARYEVGIIQR